MFRPAPVCKLGLNRRSSSAVRFVICPTRFCHAGGTFAAAYLRYCRYIDPQTGEVSDSFTVLQWLQLQRRHLQQRNGYLWAPLNAVEVSDPETFLANGNKPAEFSRRCTAASACVVWGVKGEQQWRAEAQRKSLPLWRMEDGFLRSSGLGSDLLPPLSLVLDKRGIYYDATRPSDRKCC